MSTGPPLSRKLAMVLRAFENPLALSAELVGSALWSIPVAQLP